MNSLVTMNGFLWIAQIMLAGVFVYAALCMMPMHSRRTTIGFNSSVFSCEGMSHGMAALIALAEIVGALCVVLPIDLLPPSILTRLAAGLLAVLMAIIAGYHARHKQPAAPAISAVLLALFVLVGRWP
jgi:hypothetical protein